VKIGKVCDGAYELSNEQVLVWGMMGTHDGKRSAGQVGELDGRYRCTYVVY
jgi:hypothetical protein